jgi:hypothetical protein
MVKKSLEQILLKEEAIAYTEENTLEVIDKDRAYKTLDDYFMKKNKLIRGVWALSKKTEDHIPYKTPKFLIHSAVIGPLNQRDQGIAAQILGYEGWKTTIANSFISTGVYWGIDMFAGFGLGLAEKMMTSLSGISDEKATMIWATYITVSSGIRIYFANKNKKPYSSTGFEALINIPSWYEHAKEAIHKKTKKVKKYLNKNPSPY